MKENLFEIELNSQSLTDGSKVWSVKIGNREVDCISQADAEALAVEISGSINAHTNINATVV